MAAMTKYVSVRTRVAVRNTNPPICGSYTGIMTTGDILKCICKRAKVEEILPDGRTVLLNMSNYYTDNGAGLDARVHHPIEKKVVENAPRFRVPVPQEQAAQVVETKTEDTIEEVKADESVTIIEEPVAEPVEEVVEEHVEETTTEVDAVGDASDEEVIEDEVDGDKDTANVDSIEDHTHSNNHSNKKKKKH